MLDLALDNRIFIEDTLSAYIQELDLLFGTKNTELIGYTTYGTNFEEFLWRLLPSEQEIKNYVYDKINGTFFGNYYNTIVEVEILEGSERTIYCLRLSIVNADTNIKKTYIYK